MGNRLKEFNWVRYGFQLAILCLFSVCGLLYAQQNTIIEKQGEQLKDYCIKTEAALKGKVNNEVLMRLLQNRHGITAIRYTIDDIQKAVSEVSGSDYKQFFDQYIRGNKDFIPLKETLSKAGLNLDQFSDEFYISLQANSTQQQRAIFEGLTGKNKTTNE